MSRHWQRYLLFAVLALVLFFLLMPIISLIMVVLVLIGLGMVIGAVLMWSRSRHR